MKTRKKLNYRFVACMVVAAAVFGVGVHFVHGYQVKRNAGGLLQQAEAAKEENNYAEELQHLARYLGFEPDDIDARARFGEALHERAKQVVSYRGLREAFFHLDTVLRHDPQRSDVRRRQVDIAMSMGMLGDAGRFSDALSHLKLLHDADPENADLERLMGRCEAANGRFREAVLAYEMAIHHAPEQIENYWSVAVLSHERLDDDKKADQTLDKMVEANPKAFRAYLARAQYRLQFHGQSPSDVEKAKKDVEQARQLAPGEPEVVLEAARAEQKQGHLQEARKLLLQGVQAHPSDPRPYLALITAEVREGKVKDALALVRQGLKEVPEKDERYGDLLHAKADLLVQSGEVKEAKETIAQLRRLKYAAPLLDYLQARIHVHEKEWNKASVLLEVVRPQLGSAPALETQALLLLGQCHSQLGNPDQALLAYQQARKLDPLSAGAHFRIGSLLLSMGKNDEALTELRQVLTTAKKPAGLHAMLVRALIVRNARLPRKDREFRELNRELALAAKEAPDDIDLPILQAQAVLLDDPKQLEAARRLVEKARDAHPDEVGLWLFCARLAGRDEALGILRRAADRPKLAARVELPLARLAYLTQPLAEAKTPELRKKAEEDLRATLARMEKEAAKLAETDRPLLFGGLAQLYLRLEDYAAAERLWQRVAQQQPKNLAVRLVLFDMALRTKSTEAMDRVLAEIRSIEGENGAFWRFAEASRRLQQARPTDKEKLTDSGRRKLREARQYLVEAAKQRPSWPRIPVLEGEIDELEGHDSTAIEKYQQALELGERRPLVVRKTVQLLIQQGRIGEANRAVHSLRDQGNTLLAAGLGKLQAMDLLANPDESSRDPQRALNVAKLSVASDSKAYQDHLWLGNVCWATGKPEEIQQAEKEFKRACELGESVPETWTTLVAFLVSNGKKKEAEQALAQAAKKLPPDRAPLALAVCYENIGDLKKADEHFLSALKAAPEEARMLRIVASFFLRHGQPAKAEPRLRSILALDSSKASAAEAAWARRALAVVLASGSDRRRFDEALALIEKNLADNKDSVDDQHARAILLATRYSRRKEAIRLFEELAQRGALSARERFTLVQLYLIEDNWSEADRHMRILLSSPQGKVPAYEGYYARRLLQHDNIVAAKGQLENLEKTLPDSPLTREIKARVLQAQGKDAEALAVVREYAQSKEGDPVRAGQFLVTLADIKRKGDPPANQQRELPGRKLYLDEAEAMFRKHAAKSDKPERFLPLAWFLGRKHAVAEAFACCHEARKHKAAPQAIAQTLNEVVRANPSAEYCRAAEQILKNMLAQEPDSADLLIHLADVYDAQGRFDDAEATYRRAMSKHADHLMLLNNLAWLLAFQKPPAPQEALVLVNRAIDLAGPAPEILDTRGIVYLMLNKSDLAVEDLRMACIHEPKPNHSFHLARALAAADRVHEARQALEEANNLGFDVKTLHPLEKPAALKLLLHLQAN